MTPAELIAGYLRLRDKKREIEARHKAELVSYNDALHRIETELGRIMDETGLNNLPGGGGTAYKTVHTNVTVANWDEFLSWVRETESWHTLERRAAKVAIVEIIEETNDVPPGLAIRRDMAIQVRKS